MRPTRVLAVAMLLALPLEVRGAAYPPVEIGESLPIDTRLGSPAFRPARAIWLEMLAGATRSLDLEHFYFSHRPGEALQPIVDAIGAAAARGVRVRLLLDQNMRRTYPWPADSLAKLPGVELRYVRGRVFGGGVQHAKFMVVDGVSGWLGSQNLDWRAFAHIHEIGIRVNDARVAGAMQAVFDTDWSAAADTLAPPPVEGLPPIGWPVRVAIAPGDTARVTLSASPRSRTPAAIPWDLDVLAGHIAGARREIVVQALGYSPFARGRSDSTLHHALLAAAARGVRVRVLMSDWTDPGPELDALKALSAAPRIEVRISRVPDWVGGYIPFARVEHCKILVADDDVAWIGTSNWEPGYFHDSRNLAISLAHRPLARELRRTFDVSWRSRTTLRVTPATTFTARTHGMTPPPGARVHGE